MDLFFLSKSGPLPISGQAGLGKKQRERKERYELRPGEAFDGAWGLEAGLRIYSFIYQTVDIFSVDYSKDKNSIIRDFKDNPVIADP